MHIHVYESPLAIRFDPASLTHFDSKFVRFSCKFRRELLSLFERFYDDHRLPFLGRNVCTCFRIGFD
jgi:hypothetical protein